MRRRVLTLLVTSAALAAASFPASAMAAGNSSSSAKITVLTNSVGAPFNLQLTRHGILVADGGPGQVSLLKRDGSLTTVVPNVAGASGVATSWRALAYTSTTSDPDTFENSAASLEIKYRGGHHVHADTLAFEKANNPDQVNTYGIAHPNSCQRNLLGDLAKYTGQIDSHAYSVASWGRSWLLADAGGNDLLRIRGNGKIAAAAVFPPQPIKVTQAFLDANFPPEVDTSCLLGVTYGFEPVPTDVEVGRDGSVYVTTLPGGAEDDSLGANGAVWRVNPWSGHVTKIATGLLGATNLALSDGRIYVTELFAGRVSVVRGRHVCPVVDLPGAVSIEAGRHGTLYAGTLDLTFQNPGSVVRIDTRHHHGSSSSRN